MGTLASKDLDYQTTKDILDRCANRINVEIQRPQPETKTPLIGALVFKVNGDDCRVDFLDMPLGLTAEKVNQLKLKFDIGSTSIYVMHPFHCLESRAANVTHVPESYANENGLRQLKAAIVMVKAFILREAELDAGQGEEMCQLVKGFCFKEPALEVFRDHQIDIFEAIPKEVLFERVLTMGYPNWVRQLQERRERFAKQPKRIH